MKEFVSESGFSPSEIHTSIDSSITVEVPKGMDIGVGEIERDGLKYFMVSRCNRAVSHGIYEWEYCAVGLTGTHFFCGGGLLPLPNEIGN